MLIIMICPKLSFNFNLSIFPVSMLQYPAIVDASCEFLAKHLHSSNCLGIENFAQCHACNKLEMEAHKVKLLVLVYQNIEIFKAQKLRSEK